MSANRAVFLAGALTDLDANLQGHRWVSRGALRLGRRRSRAHRRGTGCRRGPSRCRRQWLQPPSRTGPAQAASPATVARCASTPTRSRSWNPGRSPPPAEVHISRSSPPTTGVGSRATPAACSTTWPDHRAAHRHRSHCPASKKLLRKCAQGRFPAAAAGRRNRGKARPARLARGADPSLRAGPRRPCQRWHLPAVALPAFRLRLPH